MTSRPIYSWLPKVEIEWKSEWRIEQERRRAEDRQKLRLVPKFTSEGRKDMYRKYFAQGRCTSCGATPKEGVRMCEPCLERRRAQKRALWAAAHPPAPPKKCIFCDASFAGTAKSEHCWAAPCRTRARKLQRMASRPTCSQCPQKVHPANRNGLCPSCQRQATVDAYAVKRKARREARCAS